MRTGAGKLCEYRFACKGENWGGRSGWETWSPSSSTVHPTRNHIEKSNRFDNVNPLNFRLNNSLMLSGGMKINYSRNIISSRVYIFLNASLEWQILIEGLEWLNFQHWRNDKNIPDLESQKSFFIKNVFKKKYTFSIGLVLWTFKCFSLTVNYPD